MNHRLAILISGSGTTMQAIIQAIQNGEIKNIKVSCVIASTTTAGGIQKALKLGIPKKDVLLIDPQSFLKKDGKVDQKLFGQKLLGELQKRKITVFMQCGWLPLTPKIVVKEYEGRCFNQHPGSLPDFGGKGMYGRRVHAAVLFYRRVTGKDFWTESVCQKVGAEFDSGKVVKSKKIEILPTDTVEDLQQRMLPVEHEVQIEALKDFVSNTLEDEKRLEFFKTEKEQEILSLSKKIAEVLYPFG